MNRREFLTAASALPMLQLMGCAGTQSRLDADVRFDGSVLILGAGAAGLAAGYMLDRHGIDYRILEARDRIGGRVKRLDGFADVPLDLGAEWIHQDPSVLAELVDDSAVDGRIEVVRYEPQSISTWGNGSLQRLNLGRNYYAEWKFKRTTWFDFLESQIAPASEGRIEFDTPVVRIERDATGVRVTAADGTVYEADRIVITAPIAVLQSDTIEFEPAVPRHREAWEAVFIPAGLKAALRFSERFYPDLTIVQVFSEGAEKLYFDGVFRKEVDQHVMHFFWVAEETSEWTDLGDDDAILEALLDELDAIFDGAARRHLIEARVENWAADPYARGAYSFSYTGDETEIIETLRTPVDDQLYFAGEACSADNTATVPGAIEAAYDAVRKLLETA
ncbi:MAG: FAD-dependent oxidoreductase [Deltaproteobacteria bacterium]|nr:FAD-dependent oxidoreductase [Deltaproteobacteria bacterium]